MILVVSYPDDEHTGQVVQRLAARGLEVVRMDLADFPARRAVALHWGERAPDSWSSMTGGRWTWRVRAPCGGAG